MLYPGIEPYISGPILEIRGFTLVPFTSVDIDL
jgi:hypothetical protein